MSWKATVHMQQLKQQAGDWLIIKGVGYATSLLPKSLHTNDLSALSPDRRCLVIISI